MKDLKRHVRNDRFKWFITFVVGVLFLAMIGGLSFRLKEHIENGSVESSLIELIEETATSEQNDSSAEEENVE